jgi:hypothetical protein
MKRDTCRQNSRPFLTKYLPASLLGVYAGICQRATVDESQMIGNETGTRNRSENGHSEWYALYNATSNSNQYIMCNTFCI